MNRKLGYVAACIFLIFGSGYFIYKGFQNYYGEVLYSRPELVDPSLTLIVPLPRNGHLRDEMAAYLIDKNARVIHQWNLPKPATHAILLKNDHLLAMHLTPPGQNKTDVFGECNEIAEYDWNGKKVWSFRGYSFHHDLEMLPTGNVALFTFEKIDPSIKTRWSIHSNARGDSYSDRIIEVNHAGKVVWDWRLVDHLEELKFDGKRVLDHEISHANSIRYLAKNPINSRAGYLLSIRNLNRVLIIDRETKAVLWSSPINLLHVQHDATLLDNGNILIFDNGILWKEVESQVIELNPLKNEIAWRYRGKDSWHFGVPAMGGAQRLPNGNTLITNSQIGQVFEINQGQEVVWNYIVPIRSSISTIQIGNFWQGHALFRARKYHLNFH